MDKKTFISFVMPAYNTADTIKEAVDSIMQTNFTSGDELIIVNDGSTDSTEKKILRLQKKYPVIKYIRNEKNIGCPATRNVGIRTTKNNLVFNMDADDVLAPYSVIPLKNYLLREHADVACFAESRYFRRNIRKVTHKTVVKGGLFTLADHLSGILGPGGNCIYNKASWEKMGGYDELGKGLHEYWGFFLKQLTHGAKFVVLDGSFYFHRYGKPSLYSREAQKQGESNSVASKMLTPYINLLTDEDATYVQTEDGKKRWFSDLSRKPLHLKSGEVGIPAQKVFIRDDKTWFEKAKISARKILGNLL